ncbi:MAG: hypothetical protein WEB89_03285 [Balneolales bacterium]
MKKSLFASITVAALFSACNDSSVDVGDIATTETGDNYTFHQNSSMANETAQERSSDISDSFVIEEAWLEEKGERTLMHIKVNQALGCEKLYPGKFDVVWNGIMLMIYPPQIGFYLKLNTEGCSELQENVEETITLNLNELIGTEDFSDGTKFTVINASKSSTENDHEVKK